MALVSAETLGAQLQGFSKLPMLRQLGLMVGLAASVALGVAIVLWSHEPNYSLLYAGMTHEDTARILDALDAGGIPYRLEQGSSAILVPAAKVHQARIELASLGLPKNHLTGLEFLERDQPLGTSQMIERARYESALAGELSRSIMALDSVRSARVHLAIPKRSVFLRDRSTPTASVLVDLFPGRLLDAKQVAGIANLVASSIPELESEQVSIVDQKGRLLTDKSRDSGIAMGNEQLRYTHRLEETYVERITDLLTPLVGADGVRAQVAAELDFTRVERTVEDYDPERRAVRSEQTQEREVRGGDATGIPGALANEPPPAGRIEEGDDGAEAAASRTTNRQSTRNYEVNRTLSHVQVAPGGVKRLSVAVVVDYRSRENEEGAVVRVPLKDTEMAYISTLVKEAVGFDAERGDSVNVINASFVESQVLEPAAALPFWREPWIAEVAKQTLGGLAVLILALGVLRPVLRNLASEGRVADARESEAKVTKALPGAAGAVSGVDSVQGEVGEALALQEDQLSLGGDGNMNAAGEPLALTDNRLETARKIVQEDPGRVAQVVKKWIAIEET